MVRKAAPKKAAPKKVTTRRVASRRVTSDDPGKTKPWNYKDSMAMSDAEWWERGPANKPAIPNMRLVGTVNPRFVPSNTPAPVRPRNPKFNASVKPFVTPPMSTGKGAPTPTGVNRTGVEKVGRGGGIRALGRKIFGER